MMTNIFADDNVLKQAYNTPLSNDLKTSYESTMLSLSLDPSGEMIVPIDYMGVTSKISVRLAGNELSLSMRSPLAGGTDYAKLEPIKNEDISCLSLQELATTKLTDYINERSSYSFLLGEEHSNIITKGDYPYGIRITENLCNKGKHDTATLLAPRSYWVSVLLPLNTNESMLTAIKSLGFGLSVDDYNKSITAVMKPDNINVDSCSLISNDGTSPGVKFKSAGIQIVRTPENQHIPELTKDELNSLFNAQANELLEPLINKVITLLKPLTMPSTRYADQQLLTEELLSNTTSVDLESNLDLIFDDKGQGGFIFH